MVLIKFDFVLLFTIFHVSHCERRIVEGEDVTSDKSYMVYLVKARLSDKRYDSWLCGGALVTRDFIITSAACVEDVQFMYAIAGYRKYVPDKDLEKDLCTSQMKKKIVYTCVPIGYEFDFDEIEKWAYIDIALVKVESPYEFNNPDYQLKCSYTPSIIPINYDPRRQLAELDAMVLGWGHTEIWRSYSDKTNYNQQYLQFGATTLYDKNQCKEAYKDYPNFLSTIDKYMICSLKPGHLNDYGIPYSMNQNNGGLRSGCITQKQKLLGLRGALCTDEIVNGPKEVDVQAEGARKHMSLEEKSNNATNKDNGTNFVNGTNILNRTNSVNETDYIYKPGFGKIRGYFKRSSARRNGICQNDHGGPLVTWAGKREVLIGVASVFKITENNTCIGPFLYTSTMCNGAFIGCVLGDRRANVLRGQNESVSPRQALLCDSDPSVKGFDTVESYVSWKDHPDGPADNERQIGQEQQRKGGYYATVVQKNPDANSFKEEEEPKDRFSLKIGPPAKRPRIRKRPPAQRRPPAQQNPPVQEWPPAQQRPPAQQNPPVQEWPPEQEWPPVQQRPQVQQRPLKLIRPLRNRPPSKRDPQLLNRSPALNRRPEEMKPSAIHRPPPEMKPPPVYGLPPEMKPPPVYDPISEMKESSAYAPPSEMKPPPVYAPPPEMKPPPVFASPPEMKPPPVFASPPEMKPPPVYAPPPEMKPPPVYAPPPEMKPPPVFASPPEMNPPPVFASPPEMNPPPVFASPPEMNPPPVFASPPEMKPPPAYAPPPEMKPPPVYAPPLEIRPPPETDPPSLLRSPPEIEPAAENWAPPTLAPLSKMEVPEFDEMLDLKSDEKIFEKKPNMYTKTEKPKIRAQPEILLRPQNPLNG